MTPGTQTLSSFVVMDVLKDTFGTQTPDNALQDENADGIKTETSFIGTSKTAHAFVSVQEQRTRQSYFFMRIHTRRRVQPIAPTGFTGTQ